MALDPSTASDFEWQTDEPQLGHAAFQFAETQVGAVTISVEPVHADSPHDWVMAQFDQNPALPALPLEREGGVIGLYPRARATQKTGFFQGMQALDRDLPAHGTLDARESVSRVVSRLFADSAKALTQEFLVFLNGQYFGLTDLHTLVARSTLLREQDLERAREVQEGAVNRTHLPATTWSRVHLLKMAQGVGGDFYQELAWDDGTCLLGCFDVSGKGVSGSLVTSAIGGWFSAHRSLGGEAPTFVEFARKLNAFLVETLPLGTFVTAVLLMLPAQLAPGAELRILNFGFAPVFFHSRKEGKVTIRVLKPNLQPLGLDGLAIDTQSALVVPLELGLKVSTFSDGLVDLVNPAGTRFGEDSVKDFLRRSYRWDSQEFLQHLTEEMAAFQKSAPQPDDITILTLQF